MDNESDYMELEFLRDSQLPDSVDFIQKNACCIIEKDTTFWDQGYYYLVDDINKFFNKNSSIYLKLYLNGKSSKVLLERKSKKRKSKKRKREFIPH